MQKWRQQWAWYDGLPQPQWRLAPRNIKSHYVAYHQWKASETCKWSKKQGQWSRYQQSLTITVYFVAAFKLVNSCRKVLLPRSFPTLSCRSWVVFLYKTMKCVNFPLIVVGFCQLSDIVVVVRWAILTSTGSDGAAKDIEWHSGNYQGHLSSNRIRQSNYPILTYINPTLYQPHPISTPPYADVIQISILVILDSSPTRTRQSNYPILTYINPTLCRCYTDIYIGNIGFFSN